MHVYRGMFSSKQPTKSEPDIHTEGETDRPKGVWSKMGSLITVLVAAVIAILFVRRKLKEVKKEPIRIMEQELARMYRQSVALHDALTAVDINS